MTTTKSEQPLRVRFALENHGKAERSLRLYVPQRTWEAAGQPCYLSIQRIGSDLVLVSQDRRGPEESPGYALLKHKDGMRCWCNEASDIIRRDPGSYQAEIRPGGRIYVQDERVGARKSDV